MEYIMMKLMNTLIMCAFTSPANVVLGWTDNEEDPQYAMSFG